MNQLHPRREFLRIGGLSLLLAPWTATAAEASNAFEFIVVNDTHYIDEECKEWHSRATKAMRASAPGAAFCAVAGDVTDRGDVVGCSVIKELYGKVTARLYTVPGNHDYITDVDRSGYDEIFPGSLNFAFQHKGWQFLGLDTTQGIQFDATEISRATLTWVDQTLPTLNPRAPTFVFTHFPLGAGVEYRPRNADALIYRLARANVKWIHSGHWHGESVRQAGTLNASTSRCCARLRGNRDGSLLKGWHIYRAEGDGTLSRRFVALT